MAARITLKRVGLFFLFVGILVFMGGFIYFSGVVVIPPQDPPPEVAAGYAAKEKMARLIFLAGKICSSVGILFLLAAAVQFFFLKAFRRS